MAQKDPTPEEIRLACDKIRETWDESEYRYRATGIRYPEPWMAPRAILGDGQGKPPE